MKGLRILSLATGVLASVASASSPKKHYVEKVQEIRAPFDAVWAGVIEVFAENGWSIQNMEKDSGLITTGWMQIGRNSPFADCGGSGLASVVNREIRFNVFVRDRGGGANVMVNTSFRELRSFDGNQSYVECNSTGKVERRIHALVTRKAAVDGTSQTRPQKDREDEQDKEPADDDTEVVEPPARDQSADARRATTKQGDSPGEVAEESGEPGAAEKSNDKDASEKRNTEPPDASSDTAAGP